MGEHGIVARRELGSGRNGSVSDAAASRFAPSPLTSIHKTRHFAAAISGSGVWVPNGNSDSKIG